MQFDTRVPDQLAIAVVIEAQARRKLLGRRGENLHCLGVPQLPNILCREYLPDRVAQTVDDFTWGAGWRKNTVPAYNFITRQATLGNGCHIRQR